MDSIEVMSGHFPHLEVSDIEGLLIDVDGISPRSETPHAGQVPAVPPHGLDDEHTTLGPTGRLLDTVTCLYTRRHTHAHTTLVIQQDTLSGL